MRTSLHFFCLASALALAATAAVLPVRAEPEAAKTECTAPSELTRLMLPLRRVAQRIAAGQSLTIVAIGSSSTYGAGASTDEQTYPSQLAAHLKKMYRRLPIVVLNRGVSGEESRDMLARFDQDVFANNPDLVLWQVGSNSVLRDRPLTEANASLRAGLKRLHDAKIDVVLINPQYSLKVITKHDIDGMLGLLDLTAKEANVDLFQRYAIMRHWKIDQDLPFSQFVSPDGLHMNDWGYGCWAKLLAGSLHDAANRAISTATAAAPRR
jgi:lysophospholipase L1-like esterase